MAWKILHDLEDLCRDWDGREMDDAELTRIDVHCGVIREAIDKIKGLDADLQSAVEVAFKRGAVEWTRLNYPDIYKRLTEPSPLASTDTMLGE
jgi:hypothetical protein